MGRKKVRTVSLTEVHQWGPCYRYCRNDAALLAKLFAGRKGVSAQDIVDMPISLSDKLWALCYMLDWEERWYLLAAESIDHCKPLWELSGYYTWKQFMVKSSEVVTNRYGEFFYRPRRSAPRALAWALAVLMGRQLPKRGG